MRGVMVVVALGAVLALPVWAAADEPEDEPTAEEIVREQVEALHDLEQAETDEDADEAQQRFDDASANELRKRRKAIDDLIER